MRPLLSTTLQAKMTSLTDVRPSRDGDQFHYTWAARQSLRLLDTTAGLTALYVEAVDPSEHRSRAEADPGNNVARLAADDSSPLTGDEVIDLAEYWGSSDIDDADLVVYRQFKHSTTRPDEAWTFSYLTKTLVGFAKKYRSHRDNHPEALGRIRFEFITNRPISDSA